MEKEIYQLKKEEELRFEVDYKSLCKVKLMKGTAEVFGTELGSNYIYKITGQKLAIFTYEGCEIEIEGEYSNAYIASETPMISYLKIHKKLEEYRKNGNGLRVLIVGPTDSGKSSLSKILLNYSIRLNYQPIFIDFDVGQSSFIPGTISLVKLKEPIDIEQPFNNTSPISYYYGYTSPEKLNIYKKIIENISKIKMNKDGMICNTCGWIDSGGYQILLDISNQLKIELILVLGDDRLFAKLSKDLKNIEIEKINKSGGVVQRNSNFRKTTRSYKIEEYFYGFQNSLKPHSIILKFDQFIIIQIGKSSQTISSLLPIGQSSNIDPLAPKIIEMNEQLIHSILGVSQSDDKNQILNYPVYGFLYISNIDMNKKEVTFLSPYPGELPSKILILGDMKWVDS